MSRRLAGALFSPQVDKSFFWSLISCETETCLHSGDTAAKRGSIVCFAETAFAGSTVAPAANMICKKSIRCNIPLRLTHLNTVKRLTGNSCMSEVAYQSALCISQNIHILKLAEPNEHPALIDDPIVVWRNLHNRYST